jgi:hypothetical protein
MTLYGYTGDNPANHTDPNGQSIWAFCAIVACGLCEYAIADWALTMWQLCGQKFQPAKNNCYKQVSVAYWNGLGTGGQVALIASCGACVIEAPYIVQVCVANIGNAAECAAIAGIIAIIVLA